MDVTSATRDTGQSVPGLDPQSGDVGQGLGHHEIGIDGEDPGHENATEGQGVYYFYFSNGFSPLETWDKATSSDQLHYFVKNFRMINILWCSYDIRHRCIYGFEIRSETIFLLYIQIK